VSGNVFAETVNPSRRLDRKIFSRRIGDIQIPLRLRDKRLGRHFFRFGSSCHQRANARGGNVDEVNGITIDDVSLYWAEVDVPERREDLNLLVESDGKLIKTREEIDLAEAPTAVRQAAAKLVPDRGCRGRLHRPARPNLSSELAESAASHRNSLEWVTGSSRPAVG
jgi:hypothetical protein